MKKLSFTLAAILAYQIIPLLGAPSLLLHWKMLAIIITAAALWQSQPAVRPDEATNNQSTDRNTLWLILAMAGVSTIVPEVFWAYGHADHAGLLLWNIVGVALMAGGTAFRIWAIQTLGRFFTPTVQTTGEQRLITNGPYAFVRHPSYLGAFMAILGCAVLLQSLLGILVAASAILYAYYQRITVEENTLAAHFGADYKAYQANSWRLLPFIW